MRHRESYALVERRNSSGVMAHERFRTRLTAGVYSEAEALDKLSSKSFASLCGLAKVDNPTIGRPSGDVRSVHQWLEDGALGEPLALEGSSRIPVSTS